MFKLFLRNIKKGFATNSSSYHSTMIFTKDEHDKWLNGEISGDVPYSKFEGYNEDEGCYYYIDGTTERDIDGLTIVAVAYTEES